MEWKVEKSGERIDVFLAAQDKSRSRTAWQKEIVRGSVLLNGKIMQKRSSRLSPGDRVSLTSNVHSHDQSPPKPEKNLKIKVLYEDKDCVAVEKPAGMLTHPASETRSGTLANALIALFPEMENVGEDPMRPGIVHRLDRETSGIVLAARNQKTFIFLKKQFTDREIKKTYTALVEGIPLKATDTIRFDLRPSSQNRFKKLAIKAGDRMPEGVVARSAETNYVVDETFGSKYTLLTVEPKTGRTHQIRAHLKAIGNPVVGDLLYGKKSSLVKRQFLHASRIVFKNMSGQEITVKSPLPPDLSIPLNILRKKK